MRSGRRISIARSMTGRISGSMTYRAASSLSARSFGEENMIATPEKIGAPRSALSMYECRSTDFLSEKPHFVYGPFGRPSDRDRETRPFEWRLGKRKRSYRRD